MEGVVVNLLDQVSDLENSFLLVVEEVTFHLGEFLYFPEEAAEMRHLQVLAMLLLVAYLQILLVFVPKQQAIKEALGMVNLEVEDSFHQVAKVETHLLVQV